jgi:hypothetical protein
MGKPIVVSDASVVDGVLVMGTDRSITGQDGIGFDAPPQGGAADTFSGRLATRLFEGVDGLTHVFVASNQVVVERAGGWDEAATDAAREILSRFFVFYAET